MMSKKIHLGASFIMIGGLFSTNYLRSEWGLGIKLSLILGFIFIIALWLGLVWTIKNAFGKIETN